MEESASKQEPQAGAEPQVPEGDVDARSPGVIENALGDVPLRLTVELGRVTLPLREIASSLGPGSIITLNRLTGENLDLLINGRIVARGEAVAVGERYGIRVTELLIENGDKEE